MREKGICWIFYFCDLCINFLFHSQCYTSTFKRMKRNHLFKCISLNINYLCFWRIGPFTIYLKYETFKWALGLAFWSDIVKYVDVLFSSIKGQIYSFCYYFSNLHCYSMIPIASWNWMNYFSEWYITLTELIWLF